MQPRPLLTTNSQIHYSTSQAAPTALLPLPNSPCHTIPYSKESALPLSLLNPPPFLPLPLMTIIHQILIQRSFKDNSDRDLKAMMAQREVVCMSMYLPGLLPHQNLPNSLLLAVPSHLEHCRRSQEEEKGCTGPLNGQREVGWWGTTQPVACPNHWGRFLPRA